MGSDLTRRSFIGAAGGVVAAGASAGMATASADGAKAGDAAKPAAVKILGIATSLRPGKTTATSLKICLEASKEYNPECVAIELIELAGMKIPAGPAAGLALEPGEKDDFPGLMAKLTDPQLAGLIIATPVYFGNMSSLCKAFLERLMACRKANFALSNKVAGVVAVGGARNGGQEQTIRSVHTSLFAQEVIIVGDGRPTAHWGGAVWNDKEKPDVTADETGLASVRNLGRRVAEVALRMARA